MRLQLGLLIAVMACFTACKKPNNPDPVPDTTDKITINGKEYKTIKIGNQTWLAESYAGNGGTAYTKPEYGKYYTYNEVKAITLPAGWRIPTMQDYNTMGQVHGVIFTLGVDNTEALKKLISKTHWLHSMGNNLSGFNALPSNLIYNNQAPLDGENAEFWTADGQTFSIMEVGDQTKLKVQFFLNSNIPEYRFPVRFVK